MSTSFLHFTKVSPNNLDSGLDLLSDYYTSNNLIDNIESLINGHLSKDLVEDKKVLLKPNWVKHSVREEDRICLRTNDNIIIAVLKSILKLKPSEVLIGDAPIQSCNWDEVISEQLQEAIETLSLRHNIPVKIKDFRRKTFSASGNNPNLNIRPISDYIIFDLGANSYLEEITTIGKTKFRVTDYNPDRMQYAHSPGSHKYCIVKDFFESDIIISIPKIKTHNKTALTGALKNLVGINGDKDFLPHHRIGGSRLGGDCYPGASLLRFMSEILIDRANLMQGKKYYRFWHKFSSFLWMLSFPKSEHSLSAGWFGNDTTWRMVLDINKIAEYGNLDGTIAENPRRQIYSLCDCIVGGQGNGPLEPIPLPLGIISFSNNSFVNDLAFAILMGMPVGKVPLLNAYSRDKEQVCDVTMNGISVSLEQLKRYSVQAIPPKGWVRFFNQIT